MTAFKDRNCRAFLTLVAVLFLSACGAEAQAPQENVSTLPLVEADLTDRYVPENSTAMQMSLSPVVKEAAPAVVNIYTKRTITTRRRSSMFDDPFFREFFGDRAGGMPRERVQQSLGSGVIVGPEGIVVTNNHVVEGMTEIKVVLNDRREFEADVLLTDDRTDLAILKVKTDDPLPFLRFADSDGAEVGDIVLAIGNPFGVGQTVTSGIVSALARTQVSISDFQFFIQTDAAINPGNSGGALVDVDGNLLGVNTAIFSRSGGSNGIGFAIPGNLVEQVVNTAVNGGQVIKRPWLGASLDTVTSDLAKALELDRPVGALVQDVYPKSPAAKAGIKEGDVILKVAGKDVLDAEGTTYRIGTSNPGDTVVITVLRQNKPIALTVPLALPPETPRRNTKTLEGRHPLSGLTIANLSPALSDELSMSPFAKGVVVMDVAGRSLGARAGFRQKFRILSINGTEIETVKDVERVLKNAQSRSWVLQVQDTRGQIFTSRLRY